MNQASVRAIQSMPVAMSSTVVLDARKQEESAFHDEWRAHSSSPEGAGNVKWYEAAIPVKEFVFNWMKANVPGGAFLDYASGDGGATLRASDAGAEFALGIDISLVSVQGAARRAKDQGYPEEKVRFLQRDCENTQLPGGTFDTALCSGMLHHLDMDRAFPELYRIMAPGGRVICNEPLAYNPVIQLYRRRTPELRTAWEAEHILTQEDLRRAQRAGFEVRNVRYWHMLSPMGALFPAGWMRRTAISILHVIERPLCALPGLKWWSWQMTFELVKATDR